MKTNDLTFYKYDTEEFKFIKMVSDLFKIEDLKSVHLKKPEYQSLEIFTNNNDDQTYFHKKFYNKLNGDWIEFIQTYQRFIPLTFARDTASLFLETFPKSNKFNSVDMNVGEFFRFNGSECIHGNKKNLTNHSRVSLDFRVILDKDYNNNFVKESKLSSKKFIIGEYYEKI